MELLTSILLGVAALAFGIALAIYAVVGKQRSQARDSRTYKRGRL